MAARREFLDWDTPALHGAVDWLAGHFTTGDVLDLSQVLLVLPGSRAARRLLELLIDHAAARSVRLVPATHLTVGALPEELYVSQKPFAEELVQRCAWVHALRETDPGLLEVVCRERPSDDDPRGWMELADLVKRQHRELAGDGLDFGHVASSEMLSSLPREQERWTALYDIQRSYLDTLERLDLWDRQTARRVAVEHDECQADRDIVLIGTVDINLTMRRMLESDRVAARVTALVHAPESLGDHFDPLGCLVADRWREPTVTPTDQSVAVADRPDDQAAAVAAWLSALPGPLRADDITIGIADESLVPVVSRQLADCHVESRWVHEAALPETRPWTLLSAVAHALDSLELSEPQTDTPGLGDSDDPAPHRITISYDSLAALVRHPDCEAWLRQQIKADPVALLDAYRASHLTARLELPAEFESLGEEPIAIELGLFHIGNWLRPLHESDGGTKLHPVRPIPDWAEPLTNCLGTVFADVTADREDRDGHVLLSASRLVQAAINRLGSLPPEVAIEVGVVEAARLVLEDAAAETIPARAEPDSVEMVGWLELPLDDAPLLAVVGVNEGRVPSSTTSDLFLPDRLRHQLGILDNTRRIARDAYAVSVLAATHEYLLLVGGRQSDQGDPLRPSRLLLATTEEEQPARVIRLLDEPPAIRAARLPGAFDTKTEESEFRVPAPQPKGLERVSVTAFADYLACPYRFYLKHVLKLTTVDDQAAELDALMFGNLAHDALDEFGRSELAHSTSLDDVCEFLQKATWRSAWRRHGPHRPQAVNVQVAQLNDRLAAFAAWHIGEIQAGWRIVHTEAAITAGQVVLDTPNGGLSVTGRIDRIDRHDESGRWRVIDYKTGNKPGTPERVHRKTPRGGDPEWINLQLPLYRRLVRDVLEVEGEVELGFVVLPRNREETGFLPAAWTAEELQDADRVIAEVAHHIVSGRYLHIADRPPAFAEEWARICQDNLPHLARHEHWSEP